MSSLTVQLEEPTERELRRRAAERGVPLEEFARTVLEREVWPTTLPTPEGRAAAFRALVASLPKRDGSTMDDSRESIYEGRGE